jgi:hypothetical protein
MENDPLIYIKDLGLKSYHLNRWIVCLYESYVHGTAKEEAA